MWGWLIIDLFKMQTVLKTGEEDVKVERKEIIVELS